MEKVEMKKEVALARWLTRSEAAAYLEISLSKLEKNFHKIFTESYQFTKSGKSFKINPVALQEVKLKMREREIKETWGAKLIVK